MAALVAASLLFAPRARAYRPFTGTDADVADEGEFELELGPVQWLYERRRNYLASPATVLNLGVFDRTELVVDFAGILALRPEQGASRFELTDTDVLLKTVLRKGLLQDETGPSIALEVGPLLPEFHDEHGFGASAAVIISVGSGWFLAHLNNQVQLARGDLAMVWVSSLITEFRIDARIWPVAEFLWQRELRSGPSIASALTGVIWRVRDGFDCDAALLVATRERRPSFEARLGFTWAIAVWEQ